MLRPCFESCHKETHDASKEEADTTLKALRDELVHLNDDLTNLMSANGPVQHKTLKHAVTEQEEEQDNKAQDEAEPDLDPLDGSFRTRRSRGTSTQQKRTSSSTPNLRLSWTSCTQSVQRYATHAL